MQHIGGMVSTARVTRQGNDLGGLQLDLAARQVIEKGRACQCSSAEEFLEKLAPSHPFWQPDPSAWIFRGHARASWKLLASAHRPGAFDGFHLSATARALSPEWVRLDESERELLSRFHRALDEAGLAIPTLPPEPNVQASRWMYGDEIEPQAWGTRALAQHHGLPTAFLDWSRRSRVAAYFAAEEAVRRKTSRGRLAVWALRADFLDQQRHHRTDLGHLELFVAPRATNPNLHAQSGIFTILRGSERPVPVDTYLENFLACHAERLQKSGWPAMPLMRCLSVPAACAPELLRRLSYEGVTGATMFPGHDGVVRALREQAQWDTPPTQSAK